jgi:hypothetical protein
MLRSGSSEAAFPDEVGQRRIRGRKSKKALEHSLSAVFPKPLPAIRPVWRETAQERQSAAKLIHLAHAFRAHIPFLEINYLLHGAAKNAARTIPLQNDVIPLNENLNGIPLIHLVSLAQRFGQHYAAQLVNLTYDSSRFHRLYPLLMSENLATTNPSADMKCPRAYGCPFLSKILPALWKSFLHPIVA